MTQFLKNLSPPPSWRVPVIVLLGVIVGLMFYILRISNAASYLSDAPETCINCHVMNPQYATWNHSSHREVAHCNDCHVPHNNVFNKYYFKAKDGLRHASMYTLRKEPQVIFIHEAGKQVVQDNCIRCHEKLVTDNVQIARFEHSKEYRKERSCVECHRETPHGRVNSLASVPNAYIPTMKSSVPGWLKKLMKNTK
jgi:cytochrome c nitrite reductase small subunit